MWLCFVNCKKIIAIIFRLTPITLFWILVATWIAWRACTWFKVALHSMLFQRTIFFTQIKNLGRKMNCVYISKRGITTILILPLYPIKYRFVYTYLSHSFPKLNEIMVKKPRRIKVFFSQDTDQCKHLIYFLLRYINIQYIINMMIWLETREFIQFPSCPYILN